MNAIITYCSLVVLSTLVIGISCREDCTSVLSDAEINEVPGAAEQQWANDGCYQSMATLCRSDCDNSAGDRTSEDDKYLCMCSIVMECGSQWREAHMDAVNQLAGTDICSF